MNQDILIAIIGSITSVIVAIIANKQDRQLDDTVSARARKFKNKSLFVFALGIVVTITAIFLTRQLVENANRYRDGYKVGDILFSVVSEVEFTRIHYDGIWVLLAGQERNDGNKHWEIWDSIGKSKLFDARGVFLRGKNGDRPTSSGNPDGDKPLGSYENDRIINHTHTVNARNAEGITPHFPLKSVNAGNPNDSFNTDKTMNGFSETRPRSLTVNIFVKVKN